jgi:isovaleryl-CoA dehydrogenase
MTVSPEHWGGAGLGYLAHIVAMEEISRASASVGLSYGAHSNLCVNQIRRNGTAAQKRQLSAQTLSGEHVGALAMSEPGAGSDVVSMKLRADKKGDRYVLNGSKMWITNGGDADVLVVYAKTDPAAGARGHHRLHRRKGFAGFSCGAQARQARHARLQHLSAVVRGLRNASGKCARRRRQWRVKVLMSGLDYERAVLCGGPLGIMAGLHGRRALCARAQAISANRSADFQLMQAKTRRHVCRTWQATRAPMSMRWRAPATASTIRAALRKDAAGAILYAAEKATWMAGRGDPDALGGNGYINDFAAGSLWRDAKLYEIGAGTSEIRRMLIGREARSSPATACRLNSNSRASLASIVRRCARRCASWNRPAYCGGSAAPNS